MDNDAEKSGEIAKPLFMQASEKVVGIFEEWSIAHGQISRAAQSFEFVLGQEMPEDTLTTNALRLAGLIEREGAPEEIRDVYGQLYGEQLAKILSSRRNRD